MLSHRISVPSVLVNPLVPKKGINYYLQSVGGTELKQTPSVSVNARVSLSSDNTLSCLVVSTYVWIEIIQ